MASITSNPLLIIVAESMDIFLPIRHLGWRRAKSGSTNSRASFAISLSGPPEPVKYIFSKLLPPSSFKHWKIALCSLSIGIISTPRLLALRIIMLPAITRHSLFARAIRFDFSKDFNVGKSAPLPPIAITTISAPQPAIRSIPCWPANNFVRTPTRFSRELNLPWSIIAASRG